MPSSSPSSLLLLLLLLAVASLLLLPPAASALHLRAEAGKTAQLTNAAANGSEREKGSGVGFAGGREG